MSAFNVLGVVFLVVMMVAFFFPVYWLITSSFTSISGLLSADIKLIPKNISLKAYKTLLSQATFVRYIINSIIIAVVTTGLALLVCSLGGYALSRVKFFGRDFISTVILFTYVVPQVLLAIPIFVIINKLRLQNSYFSLILAYASFSIPFCMWLLRGYFATIPRYLEDAARVDGLTRIGSLFRIVLPLSLPGLAAAAMFTFILCWNEFIFAFVFVTSEKMKTLPTGIAGFWGKTITMEMWSWILASSVIAVVPVLIVFLFIQRYMIQGLSAGALKG